MAEDFATLGLDTDTRGLKRGQRELDALARKGGQTEQKVTRSTAAISSGFSRLSAAATSAVGAIGAALSISALTRLTDQYTNMVNILRVVQGEQGDVNKTLRDLDSIAGRTRAPLEAIVSLYQRASIASGELGATQEETLRFVENIGLALAQQGGSAQQASGALLQLSQALGGGTIRAEEFNSILEGAFPIAQAAARGIDEAGGSVAKLRSMVIEGRVSSKQFFDALLSQTTTLEQAFGSTNATIGQSLTRLSDRFTLLVGSMNETLGISRVISSAILYLADNLDQLRGYVIAIAAAVTVRFIPAIYGAVTATGAWVTSLAVLRAALIRTGIGALIVGAGYLVNRFLDLVDATGSWGAALEALGRVASAVWDGISTSVEAIPLSLGAVWQDVRGDFFTLLASLQGAWSDFLFTLSDLASQAGQDELAGKLFGAAARADAGIHAFTRAATDATNTADALRKAASDLAVLGFDKASQALDRLSTIVEKSKTSVDNAVPSTENLKNAMEGLGSAVNDNVSESLDNARSKTDDLSGAIDSTEQTARRVGYTFEQAFVGFATGANSASDAVRGLLSSLLQLATSEAFRSITGTAGGGSGIFGSLLSGIFGGGGGSAAASAIPVNTGLDIGVGGSLGLAGVRADGGPVSGGRSYLVGERGPEIFTPSATGYITPNSAMRSGQPAVNVDFQVINNVQGAEVTQRRQQGPDGREIIIAEVNRAAASGQLTGVQSRYGLKPQVRRV